MPDSEQKIEEIRERNVFEVSDDWTEEEEEQKISAMDRYFSKNRDALMNARRGYDALMGYDEPSYKVVGGLYSLAFTAVQNAANEAKMASDEELNPELFQEIEKEFLQTVDPQLLEDLSQQAQDIDRKPARLRRILDENGNKIRNLITYAFSGTEVTKFEDTDAEEA